MSTKSIEEEDKLNVLENRYVTLLALYSDQCEALSVIGKNMSETRKEIHHTQKKLEEMGYKIIE